MAGRPRYRAKIAAEVAAQGGIPLPPAKAPYKKRGRPPASPKVVTSLPPLTPTLAATPADTVDVSFGAALASAADAPLDSDMRVIFEELRLECMRFSLDVMRMELDKDERSFNKLLGVKQQITTAVLTATARIRPGDLREKDDDEVGALLARMKAGELLNAAEPTAEDLLN